MLTWLRDNAKIFLIATIVIFVALIFLRWGMGEGSGRPRNPYQRPVAMVNGKEILPEEYQRAIQATSEQYRSTLEQMSNPDPEAMMILMSRNLSEDAFREMIDVKLQNIFLENRGWKTFTVEQAEELLTAMVGMQELGDMTAEEYMEMLRSEQPGAYQQNVYQTYASANYMRFPMAVRMESMASLAEVRFLLMETGAQISARYIVVDTIPPIPDEEWLEDFYSSNHDLFIQPSGSLLRYATVQIMPSADDIQLARNKVDSMSYATPGSPFAATRLQILEAFGDSIDLEAGQRTAPFLSSYTGNSSVSGFHILMLDSLRGAETTDADSLSGMYDTLFVRSWEVPVLPSYSTIRTTMWDLEATVEDILSEELPRVPDSLTLVDFGEMLVEEDSPMTDIVTEELVVFASDTMWTDPVGPLFYSPMYRNGYPAFTMVRRLEFYAADTTDFSRAMETGLLAERAMYALRRELSTEKAQEILEDIQYSGLDLSTFASQESIPVYTTPQFTAAQIQSNSMMDLRAAGGLLYSSEFALEAVTAPEFQVIGPFTTGTGAALAEIVNRQMPAENQNMETITYISTQFGHESLSESIIVDRLRETGNIQDLREEWNQYLETVEDSLRAEQEQLEE